MDSNNQNLKIIKLNFKPKSIRCILFLTQIKLLVVVLFIAVSMITKEDQAGFYHRLENVMPILISSSVLLYSIKTKYILMVRVCLILEFFYALANAPPLGIVISMLLLFLSYTETAKMYLDPEFRVVGKLV